VGHFGQAEKFPLVKTQGPTSLRGVLTYGQVRTEAAKPGTQPFFKCAEVAGNTRPQLLPILKKS